MRRIVNAMHITASVFIKDDERGLHHDYDRWLEELARLEVERGCARVSWDVLDCNQPSIEFYERLGAKRGGDWYTYSLSGAELEALGDGHGLR